MFDFDTYTVESVTSGHPDKICDQISDAILDACLKKDPDSRVAIETFGSHGLLVIGGEVTTKASFNPEKIARKVYKEIGYKNRLKIITNIVKQSPDIAQGVDTGGAGDQGIMYGFATSETKEFLPKGVVLVHKITRKLEKLRKQKSVDFLRPDGKAQITVVNGKIKSVLVSTQHSPKVTQEKIKETIIKKVLKPLGINKKTQIFINPTGNFEIGGFEADTGLTGRKIMVDTYGGLIPHGGGCFSGKDPSKVDRSAAYMARFAAKSVVKSKIAKKCLVSVSYAIGKKEPLMIRAKNEKNKDISDLVKANFDFTPQGIIKTLDLRKPIYQKTATYGHFGKKGLPWEKTKRLSLSV